MRVVVTGGTGFIGGRLIGALVRTGSTVVVPVRTGRGIPSSDNTQVVETDLLDSRQVRDLMKCADAVCHLASIRGSGWSYSDEAIRRVNVGITGNLLEASVAEGVRHFLYVSSVSIFGHPSGGPIHEDCPCSPATRYGKSKCESEKLVVNAGRERRLCTTILRPVITYGPGDTWGMIPKLIRLVYSSRYVTVGTGENRVHLIYVDDLTDGIILALNRQADDSGAYILAGEEPISINRLVKIISGELNRKVPSIHLPVWLARSSGALLESGYRLFRAGSEPFLTRDKVDIMCRDRFFDAGKAKRDFGFSPGTTYEEGLRNAIGWLRISNQI